MKINEIISLIDSTFPRNIQESYDNAGPQILFPDEKINSILLSLDAGMDIVNEAVEKKSNLIITHHPFFFKDDKNIVSGEPKSDIIIKLINRKISLFSIHTNLDKIYYDKLSQILGLKTHKILIETNITMDDKQLGYGTVSVLEKSLSLADFMKKVKEKLGLEYLLYSGSIDKTISNIAILNGSGGKSIESIIENNSVDCILTGDIGYHHSKYAIEKSIPVIDAGHFGTEKKLMDFLRIQLQDCLTKISGSSGINLFLSDIEKNPIRMYV